MYPAPSARENTVRFGGVVDIDLPQDACVGIHRRQPTMNDGRSSHQAARKACMCTPAEFGRSGVALFFGPAITLLLAFLHQR